MATRRQRRNIAYGYPSPQRGIQQEPIIQATAPATGDGAELGTIWVDTSIPTYYVLTASDAGVNTWTAPASGGATTLTDLTVDPGDIEITSGDLIMDAASTATLGDVVAAGDVTISTGDLNVSLGNTTLGGNLTVTGNVTITGDFDITDTASISLTSTNNAAGAITLRTNGGTSETILIQSAQGTGVASLNLLSTAGGITLTSNLATADGINLNAIAGGIDMDSALQTNITSSQSAVNALRLLASNAAGGIDIDSGTGGITVDSTGALSLDATGAGNLTLTGAFDLLLNSTAGSMIIQGGEAVADAVFIEANNAAGGVVIRAGSGGIAIADEADTTPIGIANVVPTVSRTTTVNGGTVATAVTDTLNLGTAGVSTNAGASKVINIGSGSVAVGTNTVNIGSGNRASGTSAVNISSGTGTKTVIIGNNDGLTTNTIKGPTLINDSISSNTSINTGTSSGTITIGNAATSGAMVLTTNAGVAIDGKTASHFTVTGAADLTLNSTAGSIVMTGGEAVSDAIAIEATAGAGGVRIRAGSGGITVADEADTTPIDIGNVVPTVSRTSTINGGTVATAVTDTLNLGTAGVSTNAGASKIVNIGSGTTLLGTNTVNIGTGSAASGTHAVNIATGTGGGTKTLSLGASGTTVNMNGTVTVSSDGNAATIQLGTGAAAKTVIAGSATTGSTLTLQAPAAVAVAAPTGITVATGKPSASASAAIALTMPGSVKIMTQALGAAAPSAADCVTIGDMIINSTATLATNRIYICTVPTVTWTNISCAA